MKANEIMPEECANWITVSTLTYGVPPREGAFIKFAKICAEAILQGKKIATRDELCEFFHSLNWNNPTWCEEYADIYAWLVRAFLYQSGRIDVVPFTMEKVDY